jgi:hypothetical protein
MRLSIGKSIALPLTVAKWMKGYFFGKIKELGIGNWELAIRGVILIRLTPIIACPTLLIVHLMPIIAYPIPIIARPMPIITRLTPIIACPIAIIVRPTPIIAYPIQIIARPTPIITCPTAIFRLNCTKLERFDDILRIGDCFCWIPAL